MRRPIALLLFALGGSAANAQYGDPYGQPGYQPQAPYQGGQPGTPSYQDDSRYDTTDSYGSTDARSAATPGYRTAPPPATASSADYGRQQQAYRAQMDDYNRRMRDYRGGAAGSHFAERAAELRARADACEAGDERACDGPER